MQGGWLVFSPIKSMAFDVHWVKSYKEFVAWIEKNGLPTGICFDHDLADEHHSTDVLALDEDGDYSTLYEAFREKTGFHAAKWLVDYCMDNNQPLPLYNIHSANPVGKENIDRLLKNFIQFYPLKNPLHGKK